MVNVLISSAADRGFEARSGQTKDYEVEMCWKTGWLWIRIMWPSGAKCLSARGLFFRWVSNIRILKNVLV